MVEFNFPPVFTRVSGFMVLLFCFFGTSSLSAQIIFVNANSPACPGVGNGASWATAFCNLQDALDAAQTGNQIWVAQGVYLPKKAADGTLTSNNRFKTFFINKNIQLYGGFSGTEAALNQRNWSANPTILSGDVGSPGVHTDNSYHVVWFNGVSTAAVLNGFIVEHGFANGNETNNDDVGGGIYINGDDFVESSPTIVNCTFRNNHCIFSTGAAVYVCARWDGFARPVFLQCQFIQSGLFNKSLVRHYVRARGVCEPTYRHCSFSRNTAPSGEYEITNHVEFAAHSSTKVHTKMYNTIIWNNRYATTTSGSFTGATHQVDLFNCLSDTLGNNTFPSNSLIHLDPLFIGLETLDLNLQASSPAINAGNNTFIDTLSKDLAVQNRIRSGTVDIGAFEHPSDCLNGPVVTISTGFTNCSGNATAILSGGGTEPYEYLWSDGQTTAMASDLAAGTYMVTATDANGCEASATVMIPEPGVFQAEIAASTPIRCFGEDNGTASANVTGGTGPYEYLWSDGQATATASDLAAGTYTVTATDANGCQASATVSIAAPEALSGQITLVQHPVCNNNQNGSASAMASGGTPPYTYLWSDGQTTTTATGLGAGLHTATVTDAAGCTFSEAITLTAQYEMFSAFSVMQNLACHGDSTAEVTASAMGGVAPFSYQWAHGPQSPSLSGLPAGTYSVTIMDANGCTANGAAVFTDPPVLELTATVQPSTCEDTAAGAIAVSASGGTAPYTFLWSNGQTSDQITGLIVGTYTVSVTDDLGCTVTTTAAITALPFDPDLGIEQIEHTLTSLETEADYQWINCITGLLIPAATAQSFTASENGSYAVILSRGECRDTSGCVEVIIVSTGEAEVALLRAEAFPNPNNGKFTLRLPWPAEVALHDASGRMLQTGFYAAGVHAMYTDAPAGLYFLLLRHPEGVQTIRMVQD